MGHTGREGMGHTAPGTPGPLGTNEVRSQEVWVVAYTAKADEEDSQIILSLELLEWNCQSEERMHGMSRG